MDHVAVVIVVRRLDQDQAKAVASWRFEATPRKVRSANLPVSRPKRQSNPPGAKCQNLTGARPKFYAPFIALIARYRYEPITLLRLVHELVFGDPRHHGAQACAADFARSDGSAALRARIALNRSRLAPPCSPAPNRARICRSGCRQMSTRFISALRFGGDDARAGQRIRRTRRCSTPSNSCWRCRS